MPEADDEKQPTDAARDPHRPRRRLTLEQLLAGMTPDSEHPLEDDGRRGAELL